MDYKDKYIKALNEATTAYKDEDRHLKATLERIFPELKESEDGRMKKELIEFLNKASGGFLNSTIPCNTFSKWCTWVKNQGKQKSDPYNGVSFEYNNHTWGMSARDNGVEILLDGEIKAFISLEKSFIYPTPLQYNGTSKLGLAIEAINEETVDNANKPKFHEGDTIVEKDFFECDYETIKEIKDGMYIFTDGSILNIDEQDGWLLVKPPETI